MPNTLIDGHRNSHMDFEQIYFWTNTIHTWNHLLEADKYKQIVMNCWHELVRRKCIAIYAFVIMPNHLHVIWEMLKPNGKEMPHASFNKFTSHQFLSDSRLHQPERLTHFRVEAQDRTYRFWQRDALAILMDNANKLLQKVEYIHNNPLQEHWALANRPEDYYWSSARFYETGDDPFGILTHYKDRLG